MTREELLSQAFKDENGISWIPIDTSSNPDSIDLLRSGDHIIYKCKNCGKIFTEYELFLVKGIDGKNVYYCPDCIVDKVEWCEHCGNPYEIWDTEEDIGYCKDCLEILTDEKS